MSTFPFYPLTAPSDAAKIAALRRDHEDLKRRPPLEIGRFEIKVFGDTRITRLGNGAFIFAIPDDLDSTALEAANAYLTTVASAATTLQLRNVTQALDLLTTPITIDAGELNSHAATTPPVIDPTVILAADDQIAIDIDAAGAEGMGLGVILRLGRAIPPVA